MKPLLIGISGKAEHGKTEAAHSIKQWVEDNGGRCEIIEISEVIRLWCVERGMLPADLKRKDMGPREVKILVDASDHIKNTEGTTYWMKQVMKQVENSDADVCVVPNLRRPDEGQVVRDFKGYVLRVNRLNANGSAFVSTTRDPNHELETGLDRWAADFYIVNVSGHGGLLQEMTICVYEYILALESR